MAGRPARAWVRSNGRGTRSVVSRYKMSAPDEGWASGKGQKDCFFGTLSWYVVDTTPHSSLGVVTKGGLVESKVGQLAGFSGRLRSILAPNRASSSGRGRVRCRGAVPASGWARNLSEWFQRRGGAFKNSMSRGNDEHTPCLLFLPPVVSGGPPVHNDAGVAGCRRRGHVDV